MFSWIGFLGKLLEYIAKKVADKTIDPTLDSRKQACKAFVALFDAVVLIEFLTDDFLGKASNALQGKPTVLKEWIQHNAQRLDKASSDFLEALGRIGTAVAIYDSDLSNLFSQVVRTKKVYLRLASFPSLADRILLKMDDRGFLVYTEPDEEVMRVDLDFYYEKMRTMQTVATEWPEGVVPALLRDHVIHRVINTADPDQLDPVIRMTQLHLEVLRRAREALASFIREEFSIEDLLFVTR